MTTSSTTAGNNGIIVNLNSSRAATTVTNAITAGYTPATNVNAGYAATSTSAAYFVKGVTLTAP